MTEKTDVASAGWFSDLEPGDIDAAVEAIIGGSTEQPEEWPRLAVEARYVDSKEEYYDRLHEATMHAARQEVRERERADDQQLKQSIRAMDDADRVANELAERATEWAGSLFDDVDPGVRGVRAVAERRPTTPFERRVVSYARRIAGLADEADDLRAFIERRAPAVAPNLSEMAGPVLAARLIALAGGLDALARKPAGTVQVLGAEDALFAHLAGRAPSPKHGVIFTHEAVHATRPEDRGSAARALAGKLAIAARIDYYSGDYRPAIHDQLRERIEAIRARADQ